MKNLVKFIAVLVVSIEFVFQNAKAQITISSTNMPVAGQNYIYTSSTDSIDVTATGANKTWDFSKITPVSQDTYKYSKPASLYALSFFGDAALDLKIANIKGAYSFYKTSSTIYEQQGMGITIPTLNLPTALSFSAPDILYHFPLKYGNIDSCVFKDSTSIIAGLSVTINGKRKNTVDGWGKVTTPYNTYDCIRIKSEVIETDNIGTAIDRSRVEYKWLSTSEQIPVMEAVVTKNATGSGSTFALSYRDSYKNIVNPNAPVVSFNVKDTNVFINSDSLLFNNLTTKALTYAWTITPKTYTFAAGTKATSKNPQIIFRAAGLYTVSLSATGAGGTNTLTKTNYINAKHNTGIENSSNNNPAFTIYPNPTQNGVYLHVDGNPVSELAKVSVINFLGQVVLEKTLASENNDSYIDLSGKGTGVYFIQYQAGNTISTQKIIVK